jgi:NADPH-dependent FMN reductase
MARQVVLAISGSPSSKSRTAMVSRHVLGLLRSEDLETRFLAVRDLPAEALLRGNTSEPQIADALAAVEQASGIVFATPIFKAAYSGLLKCMLDILPQFALAGKAILPIATGGSVAHVRSSGLRAAAGAPVDGRPAYRAEPFHSREGCNRRGRRCCSRPRHGPAAWRGGTSFQSVTRPDRDRRVDGASASGTADHGKQFHSIHSACRAEQGGRLIFAASNIAGIRKALERNLNMVKYLQQFQSALD